MVLERTPAGLEARFQVAGAARYFQAAFLGVWLLFWAGFELAVLGILGVGTWALLTGQPLGSARDPLSWTAALPVGCFLLFWLSFWTFGGLAAGREWLRLLFGRDRITLGPEAVEVFQHYGLFRSRRRIPRGEVRRFYRKPSGRALCAETTGGPVELTRLGAPEELKRVEQAFNDDFRVEPRSPSTGALPAGWSEVLSLERDRVLVRDPGARRKQAMVMWLVAGPLVSGALYLVLTAVRRSDLWALALVLLSLAVAAAWSAVWLSFGRHEWRLDPGRLLQQRRFGTNRTSCFEAVSLELVEDNSGENGTWYELNAIASGEQTTPRSARSRKHRRAVFRRNGDPTEVRNFGLWLSQRCQLPFEDRTTTEANARELDALVAQLANSGRFGRAASGILRRVVLKRRQSGD
jgi:hypothetical protein